MVIRNPGDLIVYRQHPPALPRSSFSLYVVAHTVTGQRMSIVPSVAPWQVLAESAGYKQPWHRYVRDGTLEIDATLGAANPRTACCLLALAVPFWARSTLLMSRHVCSSFALLGSGHYANPRQTRRSAGALGCRCVWRSISDRVA
jgi:hypothetical protein